MPGMVYNNIYKYSYIYFIYYITAVYNSAKMPWNMMFRWCMIPFPGSNGIIPDIKNQSLIY